MGNSITDKAVELFAQMMVSKMETISTDWKQPWFNTTGRGAPQNLSGRPYSRLNELFLFFLTEEMNFKTPVFLTFLQAKNEGITINKGEKSFPVLFYNFSIREIVSGTKISFEEYANLSNDEKQGYKVTPFLKLYKVFNLDQTSFSKQFPERFEELLNRFKAPDLNDDTGMTASPELDRMLTEKSWVCPISVGGGNMAFYETVSDEINIPFKSQFDSGESFYATLLHEMTHSTGCKSRLNRDLSGQFGDEIYGREELIAELTAALMCREIGLSSSIREENAAYLKGWIKNIKKEPKFLFSILSEVNKAANMISNIITFQKMEQKVHTDDLNDRILSEIKKAYRNGFPVIYNSPEYPPLFNNPEGFKEFAEECGFKPSDVMRTFLSNRDKLESYLNHNIQDIINGNNVTQQFNSMNMQIDEMKINWQELKEKHGITREVLQEAGILEEVLNGYKSSKLVKLTYESQDGPRSFNAKIRLQEKEGVVNLVFYPVRQAPDLDKPYFGYEFTEQDKKSLLETGNLGHVAELERKGEKVNVLISVDNLTNDLVHADINKIKLPETIKGVEITEEQKSFLLSGKPVYIKDMTSNAGTTFSSHVMINAEKRSLEFVSLKPNIIENINELKELNGASISEDNRKILAEGGTVFIEGMTSRDGREYSANVSYNPETKRMNYEFPRNETNSEEIRIPNKIKGVELTEEQKTKLAAGDEVYLKDMTSSQGKKFSNFIYLDKEEKKIKFKPFEDKSQKETKSENKKKDSKKEVKEKKTSKSRKM